MSDRASGKAMPPAVQVVKQLLIDYLNIKFAALVNEAGEGLFAESGATQDAQAQQVHFDTMQLLRAHKAVLSVTFVEQVEAGFNKALGLPLSARAVAIDDKLTGLRLVEHSDLEESLTVTNMVERAQHRCSDALYALAQRFNFLLDGGTLNESTTPVGPKVLCEAFRETSMTQAEKSGTEVKLALLKLFEKHVLLDVGTIYDEMNAYLAGLGVLSEIKVVIRKQVEAVPAVAPVRSTPTPMPAQIAESVLDDGLRDTASLAKPTPQTTSSAPPSTSTVTVDVAVFENLTRVFAQQTQGSFSSLLLSQQGVEVTPQNTDASAQATKQLVAALSSMQSQASIAPTKEAFFGAGLAQLAVNTLHDIQREQGKNPVSMVDAGTIDVVSKLFDYILDEASIPGSLRAVISKLQLPYLKVGLLDKEFFSSNAHPARRLLNELAQAGMGWREADDPKDDPLYKKVNDMVTRITRDFTDDVILFQKLLDEFLLFRSEEKAVDDTQELLIGKIRNDVRETLEGKLSKQNLPAFIREFLTGPWKEVLLKVHEKKGYRSDTWTKSLQTMDGLILSVQTQTAGEQRLQILKQLPVVLNILRAGLKSIDYPDPKCDEFFQSLEQVHMAVLHGKSVKQAIDANAALKKVAPPAPEEDAASPQAKARAEAQAAVKRLQTGAWLEFVDAHGAAFRGKLIWRSDVLDDFTFVNRTYKVVAERCSAELVQEFMNGKARLLENVPLIDRALDALIKGVKG